MKLARLNLVISLCIALLVGLYIFIVYLITAAPARLRPTNFDFEKGYTTAPNISHILQNKETFEYSRHELTVPFQSTKFENIEITIVIISNNRLPSLQLLMSSLSALHIPRHLILNMKFSLEASSSDELIEFVYGYQWTHGRKSIHRRIQQGGLFRAVSESWFPASNNDYGLLLEDDIVVSPYAIIWIEKILMKIFISKAYDKARRIVGISLYNPVVKETNRAKMERKSLHIPNVTAQLISSTKVNTPFLFQTPCSSGALYFPDAWKRFIEYTRDRLKVGKDLYIPYSHTNNWHVGWKKFLFELMYIKGLFLVYPNFSNGQSLSSNLLQKKEHIQSGSLPYLAWKSISVEPLLDNVAVFDILDGLNIDDFILIDMFGFPFLDQVTVVNAFAAYSSPKLNETNENLLVKYPNVSLYRHHQPEYSEDKPPFSCEKNRNPAVFSNVVKDALPVTIMLMNSRDTAKLIKLIEHYASSQLVSTIIVPWCHQEYPAPRNAMMGHTAVYFVLPSENNLRNEPLNTIIDDIRIVSRVVLIVSGDREISHEDIYMLYKLWSTFPLRSIGLMAQGFNTSDTINSSQDKHNYFHVKSDDVKQTYLGYGFDFDLLKAVILDWKLLVEYACSKWRLISNSIIYISF